MRPLVYKRKIQNDVNARNLVTYTYPESIISEQFRTIQTNISLSLSQGDKKTFLITSPNSGEGKSSTASNLAVTIAVQKRKVLLIDANLRNPSIHKIFRLQNNIGLANVLSGGSLLEEVVNQTVVGNLFALTSGLAGYNPGELFVSNIFKELIEEANKNYDVVILDSPSILEVTDVKLLAKQCNGVILVINRGNTNFEAALEAKKELEFAKAKILGVIINE